MLLQSGLGNEWWADSMECYCYLRNIEDLLSDGKTPFERQFGMPYNRPVTPFGVTIASGFTEASGHTVVKSAFFVILHLRDQNLQCFPRNRRNASAIGCRTSLIVWNPAHQPS